MASGDIRFDFTRAAQLESSIDKNRNKLQDVMTELAREGADINSWWEGESHNAFMELLAKTQKAIKNSEQAVAVERTFVTNSIEQKKTWESRGKRLFT